MKKVKYTGLKRMGTSRPRRMWIPAEILEVEEGAEELCESPDFTLVKIRRAIGMRKRGGE